MLYVGIAGCGGCLKKIDVYSPLPKTVTGWECGLGMWYLQVSHMQLSLGCCEDYYMG